MTILVHHIIVIRGHISEKFLSKIILVSPVFLSFNIEVCCTSASFMIMEKCQCDPSYRVMKGY